MPANACPVCLGARIRLACPAVLCLDRVKDVYDCPDCGAAFYHPTPSAEEISRCYPPVYFGTFFKQY
ncbi:MAG: hypothetical protein NTY77_16655 [Elusimicrobia bacterium]|nr:hypothetical protein [Elusimicrobiota bacterium]